MLVTATLLFYLKPGESDSDASGHDDGSDDFDSVLATMYLTIMMLTGERICPPEPSRAEH